jgi:hypothetical protein
VKERDKEKPGPAPVGRPNTVVMQEESEEAALRALQVEGALFF